MSENQINSDTEFKALGRNKNSSNSNICNDLLNNDSDNGYDSVSKLDNLPFRSGK